VRIRNATPADIDSMMSLDRETTTASHWSRRHYVAFFAANARGASERLALVVVDQSHNAGETAPESCLLAYLVAHRVDTEWDLENIVVAEKMRRTGVGLQLIRELAEYVARANGNSISLEVRESNIAARSLYEKSGFTEIGRRKSYYSHPLEDAIIYRQIFMKRFS
jgi:[ribosomal protein S18]-alanine N-acetyltransferase